MEDGSMDGVVSARNWASLTQSWCSGIDNGNNRNCAMAVQGERATMDIALPQLSSSLLQQLVVCVHVRGAIVFACKPGKQWWQQHHSMVAQLVIDNS